MLENLAGATLVVAKKNEWYWTASLIKTLRGKRSLAEFAEVAPMSRKDDRATAHICENFVCQLPTADPATAAKCSTRIS